MPIHISARKKMRQDKVKQERNKLKKDNIKNLIKQMRKTPNVKNMQSASSALDKAVKTNFYHKNKVARLKSRLAKRLAIA
jgi:small subunit ribosomal protein S20